MNEPTLQNETCCQPANDNEPANDKTSGNACRKAPSRDELDHSYHLCTRLTRQTATNFYYSFLVLPSAKRRSMCALYAFLRRTDDLGDNRQPADVRRSSLEAWRRSLTAALDGHYDDPLLPALVDTVVRYQIPTVYLHDCIDGVLMDLDERTYETFDDLADYCYHVAGVVGLSCIHIWGFTGGEAAFEPARRCGVAFQLTNILRDLQEDALMGRVYLPQEDLRRFQYTADDLRAGVRDDRFAELMQFEIARAEQYYVAAAGLMPHLSADGQCVYGAMTDIYHGLLVEIKRRDGDVFSRPVGLSTWRKLSIALRWLLPWPFGIGQPSAVGAELS